MSNFVIWISNLRILSLGLVHLWFGFLVHLCVGGFAFLIVAVEAWVVVEVACAFVWIFLGRLWLWLRAIGGFGFLVVVVGSLCIILLDFLCGYWWC